MTKHSTELLEKHFDTAFAAPDGIKKLRELILTLAMQGKLVPQDPNEQPAKELLQEIEAEKQRLVKAGEIKKPKSLPPIREEEKPYSLPQGWDWARLQSFSDYNGRPNIDPSEIAEDTWLLDLEDIEKETSRLICRARYFQRESKSTKSTFKEGDVLYGKLRPYLDKVLVADSAGVCTTEIVPIVPSKAVIPEFLRWLLKRPDFLSHVNTLMYGVKMPRLGTEDAIHSVHPIPPVNEQYRIVAKINELMVRCDGLEKLRTAQQGARLTVHAAAIKQLLNIAEPDQSQRAQAFLAEHFGELYTVKENVAELRKAILQLAVMGKLVPQNPGDQPASELLRKINTVKRTLEEKEGLRTSAAPFVSQSEELYGKPEGWSYCRLGNIGKFIDYRGKTPTKVETGVPLITAKNVRFGYINREPKEYVTPEEYIRWMTRGFPRAGDILFTTEAPLGNVAIIDIEEKFALAQRVICLQLHMPGIATWLKNFMMSDSFQERLLLEATGMTATGIKASKLKEMPVPIPPLEEQYRIVAKVDQLMALSDSLDQKIDAANTKQAELLGAVIAQV